MTKVVSSMIKRFRFAIAILIGIFLFAMLLRHIDKEQLRWIIQHASFGSLFSSLLWIFAAHVLSVWRWKIFLEGASYHIPFRRLFFAFFANLPIVKFLPSYSGDLLRVMYVGDVVPHAFHFGVIAIEALLDVVVLLLFIVAGGVFLGEPLLTLGASAVLFIAIFSALFLHTTIMGVFRNRKSVEQAFVALELIKKKPLLCLKMVFITAFAWLCTTGFIAQLFFVFGFPVKVTLVFFAQPIVTLVSLLPVSIGGLGIRETAMLLLYGGSAPQAVIFAVAAFYTFVSLVVFPLLSIPFYFRYTHKISSKNA